MSGGRAARLDQRAANALESFGNAASAIGAVTPGIRLFAITRGQWGMIDAVLHCLDQVGPSAISLWTWAIAAYEVQVIERLMLDQRLLSAHLIIGETQRKDFKSHKNTPILDKWHATFGDDSIRYTYTHAKMVRIASQSGLRLLLRGSMNLNYNPNFENFDLSEGGPEFDLVARIEDELPWLPRSASSLELMRAAKCHQAFDAETLKIFAGIRQWTP